MIIYEYDDFDFLFEVVGCEEDCQSIIAPLFVIPLEWAVKYNHLSDELLSYDFFQYKYKELKEKRITMERFVSDVLDWKLLDTYFNKEVRGFVNNYTEIHSELMKYFCTDSYYLSQNIDEYENFLSIMEQSCHDYLEYCKQNPEDCID